MDCWPTHEHGTTYPPAHHMRVSQQSVPVPPPPPQKSLPHPSAASPLALRFSLWESTNPSGTRQPTVETTLS
ncbi:hypothetical protein DH86_00002277 [Scytalidium sp. 3C]|nr:hypothetical protein DH86_00002277 [Scytalidium sp. 3C]